MGVQLRRPGKRQEDVIPTAELVERLQLLLESRAPPKVGKQPVKTPLQTATASEGASKKDDEGGSRAAAPSVVLRCL
jgi:hypothetical protein